MAERPEYGGDTSSADLVARAEISSLKEDIVALSDKVERVWGAITQLGDRFSTGQRTNWGVVAAYAGVCVGICTVFASVTMSLGGLAFSFYSREITRIDNQQTGFNAHVLATEYARGRNDEYAVQSKEQFKTVFNEIKSLAAAIIAGDEATDVRVQREMRDLDRVGEERITAADTRLQEEITRNSAERRASVQRVEDLIHKLTDLQTRMVEAQAAQDARLDNLERSSK